jgi:hypothetical protein
VSLLLAGPERSPEGAEGLPAAKYGLAEPDSSVLASPWHTDADLGRPIEVITDMSKSRKLGFSVFQSSEDSFVDLFTTLRKGRLIP